jgi:hypothetical protein
LGDSGDKVNAAGFSDSAVDRTVDGITYDVYLKPLLQRGTKIRSVAFCQTLLSVLCLILKHNNLLLHPKFNISACISITMSVNIISDTINQLDRMIC